MSEIQEDVEHNGIERRTLISRISNWAMVAGLVGGYGAFAAIAARYLYPARPTDRQWLFVAETEELSIGDSLLYRGPSGETINVTRQAGNGDSTDFIALSSTCPHLGCQVFWEAHNDRYFCPCHNGIFDPAGKGIGGPPGDAQMELPRYPMKVEGGLLYIDVPTGSLSAEDRPDQSGRIEEVAGIHASGHDPCLNPDAPRGMKRS